MITTISQLIALVESGNKPDAIRFEPAWRYATPALIDLCLRSHETFMTRDTAKVLLSCSWGKYQIMGSVLYEMGYRGTLLEFANSTTLQDAWFETYCQKRGIAFTLAEVINDPTKRTKFAAKYNGDAVGYAKKMMQTYDRNS